MINSFVTENKNSLKFLIRRRMWFMPREQSARLGHTWWPWSVLLQSKDPLLRIPAFWEFHHMMCVPENRGRESKTSYQNSREQNTWSKQVKRQGGRANVPSAASLPWRSREARWRDFSTSLSLAPLCFITKGCVAGSYDYNAIFNQSNLTVGFQEKDPKRFC